MSTPISVGQKLWLNLQLHDGATGKFPLVHVFDQADAEVAGSPFALSHVANGLYTNKAYTVAAGNQELTAQYLVYNDAGHTDLSAGHTLTEDVFDVDTKFSPGAQSACFTFVALPAQIEIPSAGTKHYRFVLYVFDFLGAPVDPDGNTVQIHIEDADGIVILANTTIARDQQGVYFYIYSVAAGAAERPLFAEFTFLKNTVAFLVGDVTEVVANRSILETLQTRVSATRATKLDFLDAAITSRQEEATALSRYNALQAHLTQVDNEIAAIDVQIPPSLAADVADIRTQVDKIGTPATGTVSGDIAAVKGDTVRIGTPAGASVSADIAAVQTKLGSPAGASVSADVAAVKAQTQQIGTAATGSIASDVAAVQTKLGNPAHGSVSADVGVVEGKVDQVKVVIGTPPSGTVGADLTIIENQGATLTGRLTATRATKLDNLDAPITSREGVADAQTKFNTLEAEHQAILAGIGATPNNTTFVGIVPPTLLLPETGVKTYIFYVNLFDNVGLPADPDANTITVTIKDSAGATVVGPSLMTRDALGRYYFGYVVAAADPQRPLTVFFAYSQNGTPYQQARITEVTEFESKLETLLARLTSTRAAKLDNLDAQITSRQSQVQATSDFAAILAQFMTLVGLVNQGLGLIGAPPSGTLAEDIAEVAAKVALIGNPAGGSLAAALATIKTDTGRIGTGLSGSIAGDLFTVLSRVGSPAGASLAADLATIAGMASRIGIPSTGTVAGDLALIEAALAAPSPLSTILAAIQNAVNVVNAKVGTPASTVSADIAALSTKVGTPAGASIAADVAQVGAGVASSAGVTQAAVAAVPAATAAAIAPTLTAIKAETDKIGTPVLASLALDIAAIQTKLGTPAFSSVVGDIANLLTKVLLIPVNPALATDPRLANLDVPVSSRAQPADLANAAQGLNMVELVGYLDDPEAELLGVVEPQP